MVKKIFIAICVIVFVSVGVFFYMNQANRKQKETIKIGVILPLAKTEIAVGGVRTLHGIELAVEQYNEKHDVKIELITEDSEANPVKGVNAINKLILHDGVKYIIGDLTSGVTLAIAPIAEKNKVIVLAPGASNPNVRDAGDYIFRNWTSDDFEGQVAASYVTHNLNWKKVFIIHIQNDYGKGLSDVFKRNLLAIGGSVIGEEIFQSGQIDFRTILSKLKSMTKNIDGVYLAGEPKEMGYFIKQMKEQNVNLPIFSNSSVEEKDFQTIAGSASTNLYYTTPVFNLNDTTSLVAEFVEIYKKKWGEMPDITSAHGYDATIILLDCMNSNYQNTSSVKQCLYQTKNFEGVTGKISFDSYGDAIKPVSVKQFIDKKSIFIEIYNP